MNKLIALIAFVGILSPVFAQDDDYPERDIFETSILADNATTTITPKGMIEFQIYHRFGVVKNGIKDVYGIYAPSNIRLGLNYGITDRLMVGVGSTKDYKLQDFSWKYLILQQTMSGKMPVSVAYYGNAVLDLRADDAFGPIERYRDVHRLSYMNQIIVSRKFNDMFSFQLAPTVIFYNSVLRGYENLNFGISAGGRVNMGSGHAVMLEYDQLLTKQENEDFNPKPNVVVGWQKATATHCFQLFLASYNQIVGQRNFLFNQNDFTEGEFLVGMNITVRF